MNEELQNIKLALVILLQREEFTLQQELQNVEKTLEPKDFKRPDVKLYLKHIKTWIDTVQKTSDKLKKEAGLEVKSNKNKNKLKKKKEEKMEECIESQEDLIKKIRINLN